MGAGLSMASVNKIKELANSREYSLALELVEHQDLTKSLNPQFLRLCGEIYIHNNRYEDARRCLIMAHRLGPESKRILYTFVDLYLRMGYFKLAKTYYDMCMYDSGNYDSRQLEYIWCKHEHPDDLKMLEPFIASYSHNLDYDWSFELYLLYKKEGKNNEARTLAELYTASFKNSENSETIKNIEAGKTSVDTYFDIYAKSEQEDEQEAYEKLREEERELLVADDLRMHPKEAEITVMYEDAYTPAGSEKKVQKMLKKQNREEERKEKREQKKQRQQEKKLERQEKLSSGAEEAVSAETLTHPEEETKKEEQKQPVKKDGQEEEQAVEKEEKTKKSVEMTEEEKVPSQSETVITEETEPEEEKKGFFKKLFQKKDKEIAQSKELEETKDEKSEEKIKLAESEDPDAMKKTESKQEESGHTDADTITTGQAEDMRQERKTIANNVVVVDEDDGFEAEAETVEELVAHTQKEEADKKQEKKPVFVVQKVELAPDDFEDQYEVDDFSTQPEDGFGEMKVYTKPVITEDEAEPEVEEEEIEAEAEPEVEEEEIEAETETEIEEEEIETETEPEVEEEEIEAETETEIEEEEIEAETESEIEEEETEAEAEPEVETEKDEPDLEVEPEPEIEKEEFHVAPFTTKPEKKKLDFPVFKSSLFPDYHKEVKTVENNFDEIMEKAQDKMSENMQKEAQMQKEAEALLASLGISLEAPVVSKSEPLKENPEPKGPSRDELKTSLKIDSTKKNLLKRIKEYR